MNENNAQPVPLLTVLVFAYNHENYIEKAVDSVAMQQVNFPFKIIIGEDCSPDNTRVVCIRLKEKYPDKIELMLHEKNLGSGGNASALNKRRKEVGSKYVAFLDGDDYWTDIKKLQKQVDALEANPDCSLCFTNVQQYYEKQDLMKEPMERHFKNNRLDFKEYVELGTYIPTLTVVFRASSYPEKMPDWYATTIKQDWFQYLCLLSKGDGIYIDEVTGVYRIHGGGIMHTKKVKLFANSVFLVENTMKYFYPQYQDVFVNSLSTHLRDLAFAYLDEGSYAEFFRTMKKARQTGYEKPLSWRWQNTKSFVRKLIA